MKTSMKYSVLFGVVLQIICTIAAGVETTLPPTIIQGDRSMARSCPLEQTRASVRQNISRNIRNILSVDQEDSFTCGPGEWYRVAYLNMSDPTQTCPSPWREYSANGVRACGRSVSGCYSVYHPSNGRRYSRVCGRVIGYQIGSTDVFLNQQRDIDSDYVDGVSITHGSPRTHIWTYAAGASDNLVSGQEVFSCPCLVNGSAFTPQTPPSFVGNNYYCESGNPTLSFVDSGSLIYTNDPIWDGMQCEGQCCSNGRNPPWFSITLRNPTIDNIEVRICGTDTTSREDTPVKLLELYIQV